MTRDDRQALRESAVSIVRRLVDAGHEAYFAGGCVRDRLMCLEPTDYDIATDARPEDVRTLFRRSRSVGESFGVMLVHSRSFVIEVATFRTEGVYSDGRHPDEIEFSDAEHDAQRRDFTINGLFEDPLEDRIIDFVGGRADLEAGVIRAIGDAEARLTEDRLRMLRAVRFAARFGFTIEPGTAAAIRGGVGKLGGVSRERIGQEVRRMLVDASRAEAARQLQELGLDGAVLQEPGRQVPLTALGGIPADAAYPLALAAWIVDRQEGAEPDLAGLADPWSAALVLSNQEKSGLIRTLEIHRTLTAGWATLGVAGKKRLAAMRDFDAGLALLRAVDGLGATEVAAEVARLAETGLAPEPLLDGHDLMEAGVAPGPLFGELLAAAYDAQLEGLVQSRDQALELALRVARVKGLSEGEGSGG